MNDEPAISPADLAPVGSLLIKPVSALCNLDCAYCFYCGRETDPYRDVANRVMPMEVLDRMVSDFEAYSFPRAVFAWQGGEPTLAGLDFFRRAVNLQQEHGHPGLVVSNSFQTNGLLIDDAWASFFAEYRFLVGLSLDGPREMHDRFRVTRSGAGSWDRVMEAAQRLRDADVEVNILCCVHGDNAGEAAVLHGFFRDLGIEHVQYIPIAEFGPDGAALPGTVSDEAYGQFLRDLFDAWWPDRERVRVRFFDNLLEGLLGQRPGSCTMHRTCESYLVVEHNGDVYPCDFFVDADWKIGNLTESRIAELARSPVRARFAARKLLSRDECAACNVRFLCNQGCPKLRHARFGRFDDLDVYCASYRGFFDHALPRLREFAEEIRSRAAAHRPAAPTRAAPSRNAPCFCGSGRKYKHCCGRTVSETQP